MESAASGVYAAIASAAVSVYESQKAGKRQEEAQRFQREAAQEENKARQIDQDAQQLAARRQRARALEEARVLRAESIQAGVNLGVEDTSALAGSVGSFDTQRASNLGYSFQQESLASEAKKARERGFTAMTRSSMASGAAARYSNSANLFSGVSNLALIGANWYSSLKKPTSPKKPSSPKKPKGDVYDE